MSMRRIYLSNNAAISLSFVVRMPGYAMPPAGEWTMELRRRPIATGAPAFVFSSATGNLRVIAYDAPARKAVLALLAPQQLIADLTESYVADLVYVEDGLSKNVGQFVFNFRRGVSQVLLPGPAPDYEDIASWGPIVDISGADAATVVEMLQRGLPGVQGPEGPQGSQGIQGPQGTQGPQGLPGVTPRLFSKADSRSVGFTRTGNQTLSIKAGTTIEVFGALISIAADTPVVMPALSAGTDYAIYACTDGTIRADASFTAPAGYSVETSRMIGGFHYAPGGNAPAQEGGDATPQINAYSIWDLHWRPSASDPRGMTLVSNWFWSDIYLLGVDHHINGTSKYNVMIADGSSPPKIPGAFGGNGSSVYSSLTQYFAMEVMAAYGKRLPSYAEFAALAYGSTEASSGGTDPVSTILRQAFTSKWGVMLATGNLWVWARDYGYRLSAGDYASAAALGWNADTSGRGSIYMQPSALVAALFGGDWHNGGFSGSRASVWYVGPWNANAYFGARGVCDHVILE